MGKTPYEPIGLPGIRKSRTPYESPGLPGARTDHAPVPKPRYVSAPSPTLDERIEACPNCDSLSSNPDHYCDDHRRFLGSAEQVYARGSEDGYAAGYAAALAKLESEEVKRTAARVFYAPYREDEVAEDALHHFLAKAGKVLIAAANEIREAK